MTAKKYIYRESLINGTCNALINGYIAWLLVKEKPSLTMWGDHGFGLDIVATAFLLLFIVSLIIIPLNQKKFLKGKFPPIVWRKNNLLHLLLSLIPEGNFIRGLLFGMVGLVLFAPMTLATLWLVGVSAIAPENYAVFKGVWTGLLAGVMVIPMIMLVALKKAD